MNIEKETQHDFPVSWEQLHRDAKALAWRLSEKGPWEKIVARELEMRLVDTCCVTSYDHKEQGKIEILKEVSGDGADTLIIDDLVDTGKTAKIVREMLPNAHFATVYAKPAGRPMVDTFITEVSQNTWIHFPWDLSLQFARPIAADE